MRKSGRADNRKNFKVIINAYNDFKSLERLLESIYEELKTFEYGKGVEVCVVEHSDDLSERDLNRDIVSRMASRMMALGRAEMIQQKAISI